MANLPLVRQVWAACKSLQGKWAGQPGGSPNFPDPDHHVLLSLRTQDMLTFFYTQDRTSKKKIQPTVFMQEKLYP